VTAFVVLWVVATFVTGAMAQEKRTETQAPAAEKAKTEKPKGSKPKRVHGTVVGYEAGKTITVKGKKGLELTYNIAPNAKIKGEVKEGGKVRVSYKKEDDKMVATSISVASPKKTKPLKKEEETK
jgi:hypothetical protein